MWRAAAVLLASLLLLSAPARAMRYQGTVIKAGAVGMFSGAQYSFDGRDRLDGENQYGATAGIATLWRWSRKSIWTLVLEADWIQRGYAGRRQLPVETEPVDVDVLADFLSVPVLGRVHFVEEKAIFYAVFGPSLEFRLRHDDDLLLNEGKDFAIGMNVGLGIEYELGQTTALQLEGRYTRDLTDSWDGGDLYTVNSMRYQGGTLTLGLRF